MFIIVNYMLCIIYIIKISGKKFVTMSFDETINSMFSDRFFNKFLNEIFDHLKGWKHALN